MSSDSVVAYTYRAELLCPDCTVKNTFSNYLLSQGFNGLGVIPLTDFVVRKVKEETILDFLAGRDLVDRTDETSFDSGDFPKVVFESQLDGGETCDDCHGRIE